MGVWKDKKRGTWVYSFEYEKKSYAQRGFSTKKDAISAREKRKKEVKAPPEQTLPVMGFRELASTYLDYSERKHAKQTYQYKALTYQRFLQYNKGQDISVDLVTPAFVHGFLNTLHSNRVYNAARKEISALFEYAINKLKLNLKNPCADIDVMPHSPKPRRIPTEEEIIKMIIAARPGDEQDILMCCIHLLGRIDEILRMKWEDVNFEKRTVTLWTRKRKDGAYEADALPINEDLYETLKARWKIREQETWVFFNEDTRNRYYARPKMMASICKRAGIEPIGYSKRKEFRGKKKGQYKDVALYYGYHALRHFMASHLADQEKTGLKAISGLLRHKSLKTTEIYLHSIDESQRMAINNIEGKFNPQKIKTATQTATQNEKEVNETR